MKTAFGRKTATVKGVRLTLVLSLFTAAPAISRAQESDDATRRKQAWEEWYNESYAQRLDEKLGRREGGPWPAHYRRFMHEAARRERQRWGAQLPSGDGSSAPALDPAAAVAATGTTWVNIGPTKADFLKNGGITLPVTDTGRVRSIVVDPNDSLTIYVAMAGGGVWKTTDGGTTWLPKTETLGSLSCGALAIDPSNSSVLYLGLGDPFDGTGIGLVKSSDGGNTWSAPVFLGSSSVISDLAVAPLAGNVVLATTNAGVFRSTDAGASFSLVSLATGQSALPYGWSIAWTGGNGFALSLEANPTATSGTTDGQIWFSSDNGANWTRATGVSKPAGVGRITVASAPSNRSILFALAAIPNNFSAADLADLFKSTNAGASWTALNANTKRYKNPNSESRNVNTIFNGQGWYDQLVIVSPSNPNVAFFGGALLMARTGGPTNYRQITNWLAQFGLPYVHADFHAGAFAPDGTFYVGTDGGIFKSTNGGLTWTDKLNVGIASHLFYELGSSLNDPNVVVGGLQDNGTRIRSGATSTFNQTLGGDGFGCDVHRTNAQLVLGSLYNTRIHKSTDGGANFSPACSGIVECGTSSAPFLTRIIPWDGDPTGNTVFTFVNQKAYKSTTYAGSWTALGTTGLPSSSLFARQFGVAKSNVNVLGLVASSGRVFLSTDGGNNWTQVTSPTNNGFSLSHISFDTTDPNTLYVASVATDPTKAHLWKSTDFGASWTIIDGGGFPTGIPVNTIFNDPNNTQTLFAGTHLGVYQSTDGGNTWSRFGSGLPLVNVADLYVSPDGSLIRAASYGRGIWELVP